jgi:hypothetical protein
MNAPSSANFRPESKTPPIYRTIAITTYRTREDDPIPEGVQAT